MGCGEAFEQMEIIRQTIVVLACSAFFFGPLCSIPHCGNAVLCTQASAKVVVNVACTCSHEFCFNCAQAPHGPATCSMVCSAVPPQSA